MRASGTDTSPQTPAPDACAALLSVLDSSRDLLARGIVREHHAVTDPDLNYLAVTPLFEILFLRACQEYGITGPDTLALLAGSDGIAKRMGRACSDAGLITEEFFDWGPQGARVLPALPDEPLREIIRRLDRPDLSVPPARLPPEELAAVIDQLLGTRMQVGEGYRVVRAGKSVLLYTGTVDVPPFHEVEYTVTSSVRGGSGGSRCRVLDPACGAGLFVLAAFRHLARAGGSRTDRKATTVDLQEILRASVFGTDIDPESVSAARFMLLLTFLEEWNRTGEGNPSADRIREVCACLAKTIRCGNALIAPDYFAGKAVFPFNAEERRRVNAFDWQAAFPAILAAGGFDAVIGAPPPYRPFATKAREEYFQTHYDAYAVSAGLYGYFIEQGLRLARPGGTIAFLVPGTFLRSQHARPLRRLLLSRQIGKIACSGRVRPLPEGEAPIYLLTLANRPPATAFTVAPDFFMGRRDFRIDQRPLDDGGWRLEDTRTVDLLEKIRAKGTLLEEYVMGEIRPGTCRVRNNPLVVDAETRGRLTKNARWCRRFFVPLLRPADMRSYVPAQPSRYVIAATDAGTLRRCRGLADYLEQAPERERTTYGEYEPDEEAGHPHAEAHREQNFPEKNRPKMIFPLYTQRPVFCLDPAGRFAITSTLCGISRNDPFLAAILNSTLGRFVIAHICPYTGRGYHMSPAALGKFSVLVPDFEKLADRNRHEKIGALVSQRVSLQEYHARSRTDQERRLVQQEIDATDVRIDALVYELYGLTPEEIAVIESAMPEKSPS